MLLDKKKTIRKRKLELEAIQEGLQGLNTLDEKLAYLDGTNAVKQFVKAVTTSYFDQLEPSKNFLLKCLICIDQTDLLSLWHLEGHEIPLDQFEILETIDTFYGPNGLIAYQLAILKLILENGELHELSSTTNYLKPPGIDLSKDLAEVRGLIRHGIENLHKIAHIYPIGGAGDRLNLSDSLSGQPLAVALLPFLGLSLLEGLIRDVQGLEFLYFKLTGGQLMTPIAMMTSSEKQNEKTIFTLCENKNWFNRKRSDFFIFSQPMVPVVTIEGDWVLATATKLMLKPSGHGVIWKLAWQKGVFDWFKEKKRSKLLTRQINNPIAGVDFGLLGLVGAGIKDDKAFGFASCERILNTSEGMDILVETALNEKFEYKITNIEYTEFVKKGIQDLPEKENGQFSKFPANTNLLFLDLETLENKVSGGKIPGMLINMKTTVPYIDEEGSLKEIKSSRLESTMQNIADEIVDTFEKSLSEKDYQLLSSFLTYNDRNKTISVTKRSFQENSFAETPESCFFDIYKNYYELVSKYCNVTLPPFDEITTYLSQGPSILIYYHPALGPLYSVIAQKIQGGHFAKNSELQLEIAELQIINLELTGSLLIKADNVMGSMNDRGEFEYGRNLSVCTLKNVKVINLGIDREANNCFWKNAITRKEALTITLHGNAELIAENVTISRSLQIEVMDQERLIVTEKDGELVFNREKKQENGKYYTYRFDDEDRIVVK